MQTGNLEFILTLASVLGAVLAAFGFLHREMRSQRSEMRRGFDRVDERFARQDEKFERMEDRFDEKFERMDVKFEGLRALVTSVQVSVARIEGHLGIGFPAGDQRAEDEPPERAA